MSKMDIESAQASGSTLRVHQTVFGEQNGPGLHTGLRPVASLTAG